MGVELNDLSSSYFGPDFPSFVRIVCGQQVSTSAAKAIWDKVQKNFSPLTPNSFLNANETLFKESGLSGQKTNYIKNLAQEIDEERFDIKALKLKSDEEVKETITELKGFGPWSAEIYLMFCLARPNIWPAGDLGIQEGLRIYFGLEDRPNIEDTINLGENFAPHRTAAAILLWKLKDQK